METNKKITDLIAHFEEEMTEALQEVKEANPNLNKRIEDLEHKVTAIAKKLPESDIHLRNLAEEVRKITQRFYTLRHEIKLEKEALGIKGAIGVRQALDEVKRDTSILNIKDIPQELHDLPLSMIASRMRSLNALESHGINTVKDFVMHTEHHLLNLTGVGAVGVIALKKSIKELCERHANRNK